MKHLIVLFLCCFTISMSLAQSQSLKEDDLSFEILKWHYAYYPHTTVEWSQAGSEFIAEFEEENNGYMVRYNAEGNRIDEVVEMRKNIPVSASYLMEDRYGKHQVLEFRRYTTYSTKMVTYRAKLKTKDRGQLILTMDEHLTPLDKSLLSSSN